MKQYLAHVTLLVADYDEAIKFYTGKLDFEVIEDTTLSDTKRWVIIGPKGSKGCNLLLAKAAYTEQQSRIGNQTGGRVFLFLYTDDLWRDYRRMLDKGVKFTRPPVSEKYGIVAVFEDLHGNLWDLLQPNS